MLETDEKTDDKTDRNLSLTAINDEEMRDKSEDEAWQIHVFKRCNN